MKQMKPMNLGGLALRMMLPVAALLVLAAFVSCPAAFLDEMNKFSSQSLRPTVQPADGTMITAHESIVFTFDQAMTPASVTVSGTIGTGTATWSTVSKTNDTLTLNNANAVVWTAGAGRTLVLTIASGGTVEYAFTFEVFRGTCVSSSGADGNPGTQRSPKRNIKAGIDTAQSRYTTNCEVRVSQGTYYTDWNGNVNRIVMVEGISLLGGYATNWATRNISTNTTNVIDQSTAGGDQFTPIPAVSCGSGLTNSTILEGFVIYASNCSNGASAEASAAISCIDSSPTIQNNELVAGGNGDSNTHREALFIEGNSSANPLVTGNIINTNVNTGGNLIGACYGMLLNYNANPVIRNNTISGGLSNNSSGFCYGIFTNTQNSSIIERNIIIGGEAYNTYSIYLYYSSGGSSVIRNNLILCGISRGGANYLLYLRGRPHIIRNNTLVTGRAGITTLTVYGIYLYNSPSTIENNIFTYGNPGSTLECYAIYEASVLTPSSVKNNDFNWPTRSSPPYEAIYYDNGNGNMYTISTMEADLNTETVGTASGNISDDPLLDTNNYYIFTVSSPGTVTSGGLDGTSLGWETNYAIDRNGINRTGNGATGWSMGCYEKE